MVVPKEGELFALLCCLREPLLFLEGEGEDIRGQWSAINSGWLG